MTDALRRAYDRLAHAYGDAFANELVHKPLDRALLHAFAELVGDGRCVDLGCGPGHVAALLHHLGARAEGLDLSAAMIDEARARFPDVPFTVGDFAALPYPDGALAGATAMYAIVHLEPTELAPVFAEIRRCLAPGAPLLVAFHIGDEHVVVEQLLGIDVHMVFRLLPLAAVRAALEAAGFVIDAVLERRGHAAVEYPSQRGYLLALRHDAI